MISTELTNQNTLFYVVIFSSDTSVSNPIFSDVLTILGMNQN